MVSKRCEEEEEEEVDLDPGGGGPQCWVVDGAPDRRPGLQTLDRSTVQLLGRAEVVH